MDVPDSPCPGQVEDSMSSGAASEFDSGIFQNLAKHFKIFKAGVHVP